MTNLLIEANGTDVIWIENDNGDILGIADSCTLLDSDGLKIDGCLVDNIEDAGFDITNDYENECWVLLVGNAKVVGDVDSVNVEVIG